MKSAVSSASSGSEKVGGSGVTSSAGYDLEENKSKSTSRMSCASDDSCAINELLEGRMDLNVSLPNSANAVVFNVERRTPMLDLLVNIATQYRFNAANYTISAGDHEFKASTPIGTLDVNQISIVPKPTKTASLKSNPSNASVIPFQTTFRLQVNLPRNQLMVLRVTPNATIAAIKQIICSEKSLDSSKYQLVRFAGNSEGPQILDPNNTLSYYTLNEVTLLSNKTLSQIELQYGTSTAPHVDLSTSRTNTTNAANKKAMNSLIISQSNPDISELDDKTVLNHTNGKPVKKRPAPPPPTPSSATLPNKLLSVQNNANKDSNNVTNLKNEDSMSKSVDPVSQSIIETKPVIKVSKSVVSHVRQNSGSDSSGYHESVLSSDSPESSAVATLPNSSSMTATKSTSNSNNKQIPNNKSGTKKRRAPAPPPPSSNHSNHCNPLQLSGNKHNDNNVDESKVALECMSDVSLPLSTSSSSSGTESSINNRSHRSLSPFVITQINGSSTPRQTSMNSNEISIENSSTEKLSTEKPSTEKPSTEKSSTENLSTIETIEKQKEIPDINTVNDINESHIESNDVERQTQSDNTLVNAPNEQVEQEVEHVEPLDVTLISNTQIGSKECLQNDKNEETVENQIETSVVINARNYGQPKTSCDPSITQISSKSTQSLPEEVEVNCSSPALAISHENDLFGHECVEQVEERDISNKDKSALNELEIAEMSMPLPPPSPFQNSNHDEHNSSLHDCEEELGQGIQQLNGSTLDDDSNSKQIKELNGLQTKDDLIYDKKETIIKSESTKTENVCEATTCTSSVTTTTPSIVSDEDKLNKEIEVTLQSFDDELKLYSKDESEHKVSSDRHLEQTKPLDANGLESDRKTNRLNSNESVIQSVEKEEQNNTNKVSVHVKQTIGKELEIETIKSKLENRQSQTPSPIPRVLSPVNDKSKSVMNRDDTKTQFSNSSNGKTTLIINKSQTPTPPPLSPQSPSLSPTLMNEDKLTAEEVRQLCRPRVRLTNFSIGSYKKDVDIFEDTKRNFTTGAPVTAPVVSSNAKPFERFSSAKQEKDVNTGNQNTSKITITVTSTTATTTNTIPKVSKVSIPVIQTLKTSAHKINRINSWSGQKNVSLEENNDKRSVKANERYVSQISINKDSQKINTNPIPNPQNESEEDLRSPNLVVQSLIAKNESIIRNRSPSPNTALPKSEPIKELTTISIKSGLESVIRSNAKETTNEKNNNDSNKQTVPQNLSQQSVKIGGSFVTLKANKTIESNKSSEMPIEQSIKPPIPIPPPVPPPVLPSISSLPPAPPPLPSNTNNPLKSKMNTKIFHTKGWNSDKVTRNGDVPKVKHVEPPNTVDVRDALLNEIKSFGGKNSLKKVSKNTSWKLEVNNANAVKT